MPPHTVEDINGYYDLVLVGLVGSKAYGLDHAGSDEDYLGIFQLETATLLGHKDPSVVHNHCKALVTKPTAQRWPWKAATPPG